MKKNGRKQAKKAEGKKSEVKKSEVKKIEVKKNEIKKSEVKKAALRKEKDPKKVEAARKAWETIRAKAKAKQEASKLSQTNS